MEILALLTVSSTLSLDLESALETVEPPILRFLC